MPGDCEGREGARNDLEGQRVKVELEELEGASPPTPMCDGNCAQTVEGIGVAEHRACRVGVGVLDLVSAAPPTPRGDEKCPEAHEGIGVAGVWSLPEGWRVTSGEWVSEKQGREVEERARTGVRKTPGESGTNESEDSHSGCFAERVRKMMKRLEIAFWAGQKSAEEVAGKGLTTAAGEMAERDKRSSSSAAEQKYTLLIRIVKYYFSYFS